MCELKKCRACGIEKELDKFYRSKKNADGYDIRCKVCYDNKIKITGKRVMNITIVGKSKICKSCRNEKDFSEFSRDKYEKDGYRSKCKYCFSNKIPIYKPIEGHRVCTKCNIEKTDDDFRLKTICNICEDIECDEECRKERQKRREDYRNEYNRINNKIIYERDKQYRKDKLKILPVNNLKVCSTCKIEKHVDFFSKKSDTRDGFMGRCKKCASTHHNKTKEATAEVRRIRQYNRRKNNPHQRLKDSIRSSIRSAINRKNTKKLKRATEILGCSFQEFKSHIESQFLSWMSWDNYGNVCDLMELPYNCSWDLDHIIPISYAKTEEDIYLLNHWSNFQPLCSKINRDIKRDRLYSVTNLELNITY